MHAKLLQFFFRYRAPECLLTDGYYSYKMDMWGVGCVFFEIVALFPLFPGANETDQLQKIHAVLGTPAPEILAKFRHRSDHSVPAPSAARTGTGIATLIPHCSSTCIDLVEKLLYYDPEERLSARQALKHPYFKDLRCVPLEQDFAFFLSFSTAALCQGCRNSIFGD